MKAIYSVKESHDNPDLQLWSCEGCKDKFLLRAELKNKALEQMKKHDLPTTEEDGKPLL